MASDAELDVDPHSDIVGNDLLLERCRFASTRAYIYYNYWSRFLTRESLVKDLHIPENASDSDILQRRKETGRCVDAVVLNPQDKTALCPGADLGLFRPRNALSTGGTGTPAEIDICGQGQLLMQVTW